MIFIFIAMTTERQFFFYSNHFRSTWEDEENALCNEIELSLSIYSHDINCIDNSLCSHTYVLFLHFDLRVFFVRIHRSVQSRKYAIYWIRRRNKKNKSRVINSSSLVAHMLRISVHIRLHEYFHKRRKYTEKKHYVCRRHAAAFWFLLAAIKKFGVHWEALKLTKPKKKEAKMTVP